MDVSINSEHCTNMTYLQPNRAATNESNAKNAVSLIKIVKFEFEIYFVSFHKLIKIFFETLCSNFFSLNKIIELFLLKFFKKRNFFVENF
jgi:hypothetical protein